MTPDLQPWQEKNRDSLADFLQRFPNDLFRNHPDLVAWAEASLSPRDDAAKDAFSIITRHLSDPDLDDPYLLAAGWLLKVRPDTAAQVKKDTGLSTTEIFRDSQKRRFRAEPYRTKGSTHTVAEACLRRTEEWRQRPASNPENAFKTSGSGLTPRAVDTAERLLSAAEVWLEADGEIAPAISSDRTDVATSDPPNATVDRTPIPTSEPTPDTRTTRRRKSRKPLLAGLAVAVVVLAILSISGVLWWSAPKGPDLRVSTTNTTDSLNFLDEVFWVPASAPLSTLPIIQNECVPYNDSGEGDAQAQAWLKKYAVPQYETLLNVRNDSSSSDSITLDNITAHGKTTAPREAGFAFDCVSQGGPLPWANLSLPLTNDSVAVLAAPGSANTPDLFSWDLSKGDSVGLQLNYSGDQDFNGTVTMRLQQGQVSGTSTLPVGFGTDTMTVHWHGIPANKTLTVEPGQPGHNAFTCHLPGAARGQDCTTADIEKLLRQYWGSKATS